MVLHLFTVSLKISEMCMCGRRYGRQALLTWRLMSGWHRELTQPLPPPRGRRLHDAGGPRDAVPHRKAAQAPLRHRLAGVRAQHRPGLHAAGAMGSDHETRLPRLLSHCGRSLLGCGGLFPASFSHPALFFSRNTLSTPSTRCCS